MFGYYLRLALKSFQRTPGLTALMICSVALGICVCIVTLTVYHATSSNPISWKGDRLYTVTMDSWDPNAPANPKRDPAMPVRLADLEPYVGLGYLSKLFKLMAIILLLLLVSEIITGLVTQGTTSIPTLLGEMSRLVVLAGLLWGSGDLALLLIDMGHDVRATRILLGRQALHQTGSTGITPPSGSPRVEGGSFVERGPR